MKQQQSLETVLHEITEERDELNMQLNRAREEEEGMRIQISCTTEVC
jgi:hypothetical protein